jgi:hypothetical protein
MSSLVGRVSILSEGFCMYVSRRRGPDFGNQARNPKISASKKQPAATLGGELHMLVFAVKML